jgi:protocatechuate 4,5-dioxygenase alpha chain
MAMQAAATSNRRVIPGTPVFDGEEAMKGLALNIMCFTFNKKENRDIYKADPAAYCKLYNLTPEQTEACTSLNVLAMLRAGGNAYYLAKLAGIYNLNMQDIGAQQTGMTLDAFKAKLVAYREQ